MDLYEAIRQRRSVRSYADAPVEEDKLTRLLEAARLAPTARNRQQFKLVVVRDAKTRHALAKAAGQPFLAEAPVIVAVVGLTPDERMHCQVPADPVDCAIVIDHMVLSAVAEGLGTCWIGHFDQDACRAILSVPDSAKIVELLPLGYPADSPGPKSRKPLETLVAYETYS